MKKHILFSFAPGASDTLTCFLRNMTPQHYRLHRKKDLCLTFIVSFMLPLAEVHGQSKRCVHNNKPYVFLPPGFLWNQWALAFIDWMKAEVADPLHWVSPRYFLSVLRKEYPHVLITRTDDHLRCDMCYEYRQKMLQSDNDMDRKKYAHLLQMHNAVQDGERKEYAENCIRAHNNPDDYISIIIDAMSEIALPWSKIKTHQRDEALQRARLKMNVYGLINHAYNISEFYTHLNTFGKNTNVVTSIIWQHLRSIYARPECKKLPRNLFVQLDNTVSQNKNNQMFFFLGYLVGVGIFDKVQLSFLLVGHTHADIDQLFSNVLRCCMMDVIFSPQEFAAHASALFSADRLGVKRRHTVKELQSVWDFKTWLEPHGKFLSNFESMHGFLFQREKVDGEMLVTIRAKELNQLETWSDPLPLFNSFPAGDAPAFERPTIAHITSQGVDKILQSYKDDLLYRNETHDFLTKLRDDPFDALHLNSQYTEV